MDKQWSKEEGQLLQNLNYEKFKEKPKCGKNNSNFFSNMPKESFPLSSPNNISELTSELHTTPPMNTGAISKYKSFCNMDYQTICEHYYNKRCVGADILCHEFIWKIENITSHSDSPIVLRVPLSVEDSVTQWQINVCPKISLKDLINYLVIWFCAQIHLDAVIHIRGFLSILNKDNVCQFPITFEHIFSRNSEIYPYYIAINYEQMDSNILYKNSLSIYCKLIQECATYNNIYSLGDPEYNARLQALYEDRVYTDVSLVTYRNNDYKNKDITRAHRIILATKSVYFAQSFAKSSNVSDVSLFIRDITTTVLRDVLNFVYTRKCPNFNSDVENILHAAHKLQIHELKQNCISELTRKINKHNAVCILKLAYDYKCSFMKCYASAIIKKYFNVISRSQTWIQLKETHPQIIEDCFNFKY